MIALTAGPLIYSEEIEIAIKKKTHPPNPKIILSFLKSKIENGG